MKWYQRIKRNEEKFGDERRTEISNQAASIDDEDLIPEEQIVITLVADMSNDSLLIPSRAQNRGGRGVRGTSLNENDVVELMVYTRTH